MSPFEIAGLTLTIIGFFVLIVSVLFLTWSKRRIERAQKRRD